MTNRIYKYDNVKALLIFLVVLGHMTTDYVSDSQIVRWTTLWIYAFHMPCFIFISGLVHKHYITDERASLGIKGETILRIDKVLGFFLCGYALKVFLQFTRTLMRQNPLWHWIEEPGIPWYLFVMAEYELLFFLMRRIDSKVKPAYMVAGSFVLSAGIGYFPAVGDAFCLSRMINFLPIYMLGYYIDMKRFPAFIERKKYRVAGWIIIVATLLMARFAPWGAYSLRKWFTGRRSYEFLSDYFGSSAITWGWALRLVIWVFAILLSFAIIAVVPDRDLGYVTKVGERTLNVYFWHRPVCYLFRNWAVLPRLCVLFDGTYKKAGSAKGLAFGGSEWSMIAAYVVYILIAIAMTAFFALKIFEHPCSDLMKLAKKVTTRGSRDDK